MILRGGLNPRRFDASRIFDFSFKKSDLNICSSGGVIKAIFKCCLIMHLLLMPVPLSLIFLLFGFDVLGVLDVKLVRIVFILSFAYVFSYTYEPMSQPTHEK